MVPVVQVVGSFQLPLLLAPMSCADAAVVIAATAERRTIGLNRFLIVARTLPVFEIDITKQLNTSVERWRGGFLSSPIE